MPKTAPPRPSSSAAPADQTLRVSARTAAEMLNICEQHVRKLLRQGDLVGARDGNAWRVEVQSIEEYRLGPDRRRKRMRTQEAGTLIVENRRLQQEIDKLTNELQALRLARKSDIAHEPAAMAAAKREIRRLSKALKDSEAERLEWLREFQELRRRCRKAGVDID